MGDISWLEKVIGVAHHVLGSAAHVCNCAPLRGESATCRGGDGHTGRPHWSAPGCGFPTDRVSCPEAITHLHDSPQFAMVGSREFVDFAIELLGPFGTVSSRRMFGGHGIFLDDLMFAIVHGEALWFKTDEMNRAEFVAAGSEPFSYMRAGKAAVMGFHRAPVDAMDSPAAALPWARSAYAAALRARGARPQRPVELALAPFAPGRARVRTAQPGRAAKSRSADRRAAKRPSAAKRSAKKSPVRARSVR